MQSIQLKSFIVLFLFTGCILYSCQPRTGILSFKNCQATYQIYPSGKKELYTGHYMTNEMQLESAQRFLAACLCEDYIRTHDSAVGNKIIELYNEEESYFPQSTTITTNNIDSIIKYRDDLFNPTIIIE